MKYNITTSVYVPAGVSGILPSYTKANPLGQQSNPIFSITSAVLKPSIPGVNLVQVQSVNGTAVSVNNGDMVRPNMTPRVALLKK